MTENIWEYIRDEDVAEAMRLVGCEEKYISGGASDFEKLREWLSVLVLFEGSETAKKSCEKIGLAIKEELTPDKINACSAACIWQKYASLNSLALEELSLNCCEGKDNYTPSCKRENITADFFNNTTPISSLAVLLSKDVKEKGNVEISLEKPIDVCLFEGDFNRPDRYSAEKVLKKIENGEKCNNKENNLLLCQLICEIIYAKKDNYPRFVFDIKKGSECAEGLIKYLVKRELRARIYLLIDSTVPPSRVRELCLCGSRECFVTPLVSENYSECLDSLALIYPRGMINHK